MKKLSRSKNTVDWSELPYDLLVSISNKLLDIGDFVLFSSVCRNWGLVYHKRDWKPHGTIPWLMLNDYFDNEHHITKRRFFSLSSFKIYNLPLPEASRSKCWGTSHGWIMTFNQDSPIRMVNPISRASINFPRNSTVLMNNNDWFSAIRKATVLKLRDQFVAMIMYEHTRALAFAKQGDSDWTKVNLPSPVTFHFLHVVCFKDQILAITMLGTLMLVDIEGPDGPRVLFVASPPEREKGWLNIYLVESRDELLLVFLYKRDSFKTYKLDILRREWIQLNYLGDAVLLVDDYGCISASDYGYSKGSNVYFVGDNLETMFNSRGQRGVYLTVNNVKDNSSEELWICDGSPLYTCPVWMVPRLW